MSTLPIGPLELLVMQATTLCNLNCRYCYLTVEQRRTRSKMSQDVVRNSIERVLGASLVTKPFSIVWHSGEPLAAGYAFFEEAFETIHGLLEGRPYTHVIQTNGTLINPRWVELFKKYRVNVGVSLDGPREIHDRNRLDWGKNGSFERTLAGVQLLKQEKIPFYTISVVGRESVKHGRALYQFLRGLGPSIMGFSAEETEGANQSELHSFSDETLSELRTFWAEIYQEALRYDELPRVREFKNIYKGLYEITQPPRDVPTQAQLITPYRILSVGINGDFSTFSPELLPLQHERYGSFVFGNVMHDNLLDVFHHNLHFQRIAAEIQKGVASCKKSCDFFNICRGGAPSNKLMEHGRFDVTETMFCRHSRQTPALAVIEQMESALGVAE